MHKCRDERRAQKLVKLHPKVEGEHSRQIDEAPIGVSAIGTKTSVTLRVFQKCRSITCKKHD
jgi:hypothetical protein